jgi:hypothetical protein
VQEGIRGISAGNVALEAIILRSGRFPGRSVQDGMKYPPVRGDISLVPWYVDPDPVPKIESGRETTI